LDDDDEDAALALVADTLGATLISESEEDTPVTVSTDNGRCAPYIVPLPNERLRSEMERQD
jgi:hypothetical protein